MKRITLTVLSLLTFSSAYALQDLNVDKSISSTNAPMSLEQYVDLKMVQSAFNKSLTKDNIKVLTFNPYEIAKIRIRTKMPTQFVLPKGETIASYRLGDDYVFSIDIQSQNKDNKYLLNNMFSVEALYAGADTALTIVGSSGRIYSFYIRSDSHESDYVSDFVVFVTLDGKINIEELSYVKQPLPLDSNPKSDNDNLDDGLLAKDKSTLKNFNWSNAKYGYKIKDGNTDLAPTAIFDDGYFTYFQFKKDGARSFPLVYKVVDGYDVPVNNRIEGDYIIVESTGMAFTIRAGEEHLCIRHKDYED